VQNTVRLKIGPNIVGDKVAFRSMPESAIYDPETETLHLGDLDIVGVEENVWNYQYIFLHVSNLHQCNVMHPFLYKFTSYF
jgi:hypothetical protein